MTGKLRTLALQKYAALCIKLQCLYSLSLFEVKRMTCQYSLYAYICAHISHGIFVALYNNMKSASLSWRRAISKTFTNINFKECFWGYIFALKYPSIQLACLSLTFEKITNFKLDLDSQANILQISRKTLLSIALLKLLQVLCIYFLITLYIIYCIDVICTSSVDQPYEACFTLPSLVWPYSREASLINALYTPHIQFHLSWWYLNKCT